MTLEIDASRLRGVTRTSTYLAIRSTQGGREVYNLQVPLADLPVILPVPDPDRPDEDNRRVDRTHARGFGQYLHNKPDWVAPALLARDGGVCDFSPIEGSGGRVGYLEVPWVIGTVECLSIIDGQHRVLGVHLEQERISRSLNDINRDLRKRISEGRTAKLTAERDALISQMKRLNEEFVGLSVYVERDFVKARQMFVDVADNAKGMSAAVRARFDGYRVANRTLDQVIRHEMLLGRVDPEQDRMTSKNPHFIGAKHVADLTRAVVVGPGGRISKRVESEVSDAEVIDAVTGFLDAISESFTDLARMTNGEVDPITVRATSMLGSVGMLRVLGGVYRELSEAGVGQDGIKAFFEKLDRHMAAPVDEDSVWRTTTAKEHFEPDAKAPIMRTQNLVALTKIIVSWYEEAPATL
ncbi:DNA sulfur modification protein DndB [Kitasatospora sp. NPDC101157]|uniref:DNA sulfur modification protein DndB n=1 Tax=Kitasatospora sp. NPDC101157 TaxID=3364098 RepID=UPI0037F3ACA4